MRFIWRVGQRIMKDKGPKTANCIFTIECGFTLKRVRDMIRTYSQRRIYS